MLYAFTDESYSPRQYFQAAYIVDGEQLLQIEQVMEGLRAYTRGIGIQGSVEFHGHAIMNAKDNWKPLSGRFDLKIKIFKYFVEQVKEIDGSLLIQGLDLTGPEASYELSTSPHLETSKNLLRAIDEYSEMHGRNICVFSDKVSKEDRQRIRFDLLNQSSIFPRIKSVNFVDSSDFPGIQIADMCIYLYRRLVDHHEINPRTKYLVDELWKSLAFLVNRPLGH
jgi:hypothetical protein